MAKIDFKENGSKCDEVIATSLQDHLYDSEGNFTLGLPDGLVSPSLIFERLYHAVATKLSNQDLKHMARMSEDADCQSVQLEHTLEKLASGYSEVSDSEFSGYEVSKLLWGASSTMANIRAMYAISSDAEFILSKRTAKQRIA